MNAFEKLASNIVDDLMPSESKFNMTEVRDFIENNLNYVRDNGYDDKDLEIAMRIRAALQARAKANIDKPLNGDAVHVYGRNNVQYANARITEDVYKSLGTVVCTQPSVPSVSERGGNIYTSTSGGYFHEVKNEQFKNVGKKSVMFLAWGRFGSGAHQAIYFMATMNAWEVADEYFY